MPLNETIAGRISLKQLLELQKIGRKGDVSSHFGYEINPKHPFTMMPEIIEGQKDLRKLIKEKRKSGD